MLSRRSNGQRGQIWDVGAYGHDLGGETGTHYQVSELECTSRDDYDSAIEAVFGVNRQESSLGAFDRRSTCYEPSRDISRGSRLKESR